MTEEAAKEKKQAMNMLQKPKKKGPYVLKLYLRNFIL